MPSRTLPTFTRAEVEAHNNKKSCYVTIGANVYDVTDFAHDHPGGADLVFEYAGKDVEAILRDPTSHPHSEAAYEVLDDSLVGFVINQKTVNGSVSKTNGTVNGKVNGHANGNGNGNDNDTDNGVTKSENEGVKMNERGELWDGERWVHPRTGMASEEDLSKETDYTNDYKKHKFLDLSRPLFPQIWYGGFSKEFYLDQVHRPRHYKGGESAPLFGNFLEPLSKTPWWVVPLAWLPPVAYSLYLAREGMKSTMEESLYFGLGLFLWTLIEYILHRFLFHLDQWLPDNRVGITAHFLLHGIHHYLPMDKYRLVMPPTLFVVLATPFYKLAHCVFSYSWHVATAVFCGGIFGYVCYDLTHYFLHHQNLPLWYKELKKYHLQHHFLDYELGFGVTSRFWDSVFGTELPPIVKAN
ncbi:cytochrome b5-like Heme/Steroid binding domain-containing protein [Colletotrichum graminicola]|uniref:Cytochrome b5-like Heme/Steroid binding domain-containing protein n=1 Tax=Colletotrichum graminicola (strain M1.001 / M2 / FGSC 10212) TaxID=645133 RepID=E3QRB0_COLGM|nr:cytochrome b5-like Heme/Steroid binding domain-containing protein [Colletotrichum graminicola M1.001]EFQ33398.1 cytochrome b5-like Heme/Steroid binding domain-containing protein [Colletotrichum graminicola M1.001]WDK09607.1 cytochrome b5-like Heme/Steroid binding domain-containing protein [Colletotrichum graminicola]